MLQNLNNQRFGIILNNLNIYNNLTQSKQDRWLLKNSLLSNSSTVDLNAFTQTKTLLGDVFTTELKNVYEDSDGDQV